MPARYLAWCFVLPLLMPSYPLGSEKTTQRGPLSATPPQQGVADILFLDVGAGLSVVIRTKNRVVVYDTGPSFAGGTSAVASALQPYLRALGINTVDLLVLSHADNDHAGGWRDMHRFFNVPRVVVGDSMAAWQNKVPTVVAQPSMNLSIHTKNPDSPAEVLASLNFADHHEAMLSSTIMGRCPFPAFSWTWDDVRFTLMRPSPENGEETKNTPSSKRLHDNNKSCLLKITSASGLGALLTGDIERPAQAALLEPIDSETGSEHTLRLNLAADYLQAPHHGSATSDHAPFYNAVSPKWFLVSGGYSQRHYPAPTVAMALETLPQKPQIHHTWHDGALWLSLGDEPSQSPQNYRDIKPRYWHHPS